MANWTEWLESAIAFIAGGLAVGTVVRWLARGQTARPPFTASGAVLRHGSALLVLSVVCTLFFVACAYFSVSRTGGPKVAAFFMAFALIGAICCSSTSSRGTRCDRKGSSTAM